MLCYGGEKRKRSECLAPSKREDGHLRTMGVVTIATKSTTTSMTAMPPIRSTAYGRGDPITEDR